MGIDWELVRNTGSCATILTFWISILTGFLGSLYVWEVPLTAIKEYSKGTDEREKKITILGMVTVRYPWNIPGSWSIAGGYMGVADGLKSGLVMQFTIY